MVSVGTPLLPQDDYTPRASGLRRNRQCGVPTLVLVTTVRQKKKNKPFMHMDPVAGIPTLQIDPYVGSSRNFLA